MIKDLFVSFKDNIKAKTTNPFFGTLIVVWLFHNYKFVYTIFNFRTSTGLDDRLTFIGTYLESDKFLPNLLWCIGYAILVLVATYILMNFSRLIVYTFDKKVTPWIKKITDSKSIVSRERYDAEKLEKERMQNRFEQEQEAKLKLQNEYENLEKKYQELLKDQPNEVTSLAELLKSPDAEQEKSQQNPMQSTHAIVGETNKDVGATASGNYYVNKNAQANGDHEVHKSECSYMPSSENRIYLGNFSTCQEAMKEAKKHYSRVNGCYYCSISCHLG